MKTEVIRILRKTLSRAITDLARAEDAFRNIPISRMDEEYLKSGRSYARYLRDRQDAIDNAQACIDWVASRD